MCKMYLKIKTIKTKIENLKNLNSTHTLVRSAHTVVLLGMAESYWQKANWEDELNHFSLLRGSHIQSDWDFPPLFPNIFSSQRTNVQSVQPPYRRLMAIVGFPTHNTHLNTLLNSASFFLHLLSIRHFGPHCSIHLSLKKNCANFEVKHLRIILFPRKSLYLECDALYYQLPELKA